jgi:hypothetical protein
MNNRELNREFTKTMKSKKKSGFTDSEEDDDDKCKISFSEFFVSY